MKKIPLFFIVLVCMLAGQLKAADDFLPQSRWIGSEHSQSTPNTWLCFRKTIELPGVPGEMIANIAVDSKYWLWINGELVVFEGGLKRGPAPGATYYDRVDTLNYKCPNCSAGLTFDSKEQKMKCEFCGSTYSLEELDKLAEQQDTVEEDKTEKWKGVEPEQWQSDEKSNMAVWNCPSCGAEILAEKTTGSTVCPYCDNPMIMPEQFKDSYRPDYIIPFMKSKKEAKQALKAHYEGKPLLPKVFKDENHLEEIRAVYVPFWLFDLDTAGRFSYEATKTRVWEDDDYNYTATRFYHVARAGKINFRKIPVDGSKAIDDTMMEAIEPYEYQDLTEFNMSYLSGYMADKYDLEPDELTGRVYERMEQSVKDCFEASVKGYVTVTPKQEKVTVTNKGEVKYGLFPVWFLNTKWNGKTYSFAMNGQTGRLIGDLPVGKDLAVKYWFKCHIPLTIAMTAIVTALRFMGVI